MAQVKQETQLTLNFEAGLTERFSNIREVVHYRILTSGKKQGYVAAELDMSPSDLSRKLAKNPDDNRRSFSTDDLEKFYDTQEDFTPILYQLERWLMKNRSREDELLERIRQLEAKHKGKRK